MRNIELYVCDICHVYGEWRASGTAGIYIKHMNNILTIATLLYKIQNLI